LRDTAALLRQTFRDSDWCPDRADEYAVLVRHSGPESAEVLAERLKRQEARLHRRGARPLSASRSASASRPQGEHTRLGGRPVGPSRRALTGTSGQAPRRLTRTHGGQGQASSPRSPARAPDHLVELLDGGHAQSSSRTRSPTARPAPGRETLRPAVHALAPARAIRISQWDISSSRRARSTSHQSGRGFYWPASTAPRCHGVGTRASPR